MTSASEVVEALRAKALLPPPAALARLANAFELGEFEQQLAMLAFALETDAEVAPLIAALSGEREVAGLPLGLAHVVLGTEDWRASSPLSPLRRWHILEEVAPAPRTLLRLRLAETVVDAMLGWVALDAAFAGIATPLAVHHAAMDELVQELAGVFAQRGVDGLSPVILGQWPGGLETAAAAAERLGFKPYRLDATHLALAADRVPRLQRLWERDVVLQASLPIFASPSDPERSRMLAEFCSGLASHVVILGTSAPVALRRAAHRVVRERATSAATVALWRQSLGVRASERLNGSVERAAAHFDLAPAAIVSAAEQVRAAVENADNDTSAEHALWRACGRAAWPDPGPLASVTEPSVTWSDLIVPHLVQEDLFAIVRQVRHAATVFEDWGFGTGVPRGRGLLALFAGPSGTGKTLAAEVIAAELRLPLVRADFSQLQSKWVGETPKLVGRLFDQLEAGGAVLLIDEADGLIGRRGAVVEANDRHANVEVAYFLQRLEAFRGLAILTTNLKSAIDEAFVRRFRFIVDFPMPGVAERKAIWNRVFPKFAPRQDLDAELLAKLPLSGGAIRNIALNAAFLAADTRQPISQAHVISALRAEYRKLERSPAEIEIGMST